MNLLKRCAAVALAAAIALCGYTVAFAADEQKPDSSSADNDNRQTVETPTANVESGDYDTNKYVTLSCKTPDARIFYTTDGSYPTVYSTEYTKAIRVKGVEGETVYRNIRAIAVKTGYKESELLDLDYYITLPKPKDVTYMELQRAPTKKTYRKGEQLDVSGGVLLITYDDNSVAKLNISTKMISGFNTNTAGEKLLTVTYKGFTDSFTITVRPSASGNGGESSTVSPDDILKDETVETALPQISGHTTKGWSDIKKYITDTAAEETKLTIILNDDAVLPSGVIREAAKKKLVLTLISSDNMQWKLDTANINTSTVKQAGYGIRTDAMYIPKTYANNIGGTVVEELHFNSSNRYSADFIFTTDKAYAKQIASLYKYNSKTKTVTLVDSAKINVAGKVTLTPKTSGDYFIIVDEESKIKGDFNNNLKLDKKDLNKLLADIAAMADYSYKADINGDGFFDSKDLKAMCELMYD